jgi:hypothetical protein
MSTSANSKDTREDQLQKQIEACNKRETVFQQTAEGLLALLKEARAANPAVRKTPGGTTGLVDGRGNVDLSLFRELRAALRQAAMEARRRNVLLTALQTVRRQANGGTHPNH